MTKREAMQILINFSAKWGAGCGVGIRETLSQKDQEEIRQAIQKLWVDAYDYPFHNEVFFNLGL